MSLSSAAVTGGWRLSGFQAPHGAHTKPFMAQFKLCCCSSFLTILIGKFVGFGFVNDVLLIPIIFVQSLGSVKLKSGPQGQESGVLDSPTGERRTPCLPKPNSAGKGGTTGTLNPKP